MPNIRIHYITGFGLEKNTGRNKATREKTAALQEIIGKENFRLWHPASSPNRFISYMYQLLFDCWLLPRMLFIDKKTVVIERQAILPLTNTLLWFRGVRMFCEVHADPKEEIFYLQKTRLEKLLLRMLYIFEWYNWQLAMGMIYNNPLLQKQLESTLVKPSVTIYNGCDTNTFIILNSAACRKKLGLLAETKYFLILGEMSRWRGIDLLIDVFKQEALRDHILLVVGVTDSAYSRQLRAAAPSNVHFIDHTDVLESVEYINASDVCLVPVNNIRSSPGSPLKLYDYIACGKPVVAQANTPGYSDEVLRYKLGGITDFRNPKEAAAELNKFQGEFDSEWYKANNRAISLTRANWHQRMTEVIQFLTSNFF